MTDFKGVALVTGAGVRVGRQIALTMGQNGYKIAVHYRASKQPAEAVCHLIESTGGDARPFQLDLSDGNAVKQLIPEINKEFGPVSCLINNASIFVPDAISNMDDKSWYAHMDINLKAPLLLAQSMAANLGENDKGNIINILDQKVWRLTPFYMSYTLSKAALWTATQTLAQSLVPNIRVNAIGPGPVLRNDRQTEEAFEDQCKKLPLQDCTSPTEIANAILFILSSPAMTGQMIALDGGRHLAWQTPDVTNTHEL